ncbi:lysine--tRNA ligase [Enterococcus devriesei]|uniref:Lysine--tRNA ligase n=1 Tax=Enterococcus devriesei TaxID=319970 RepID=A0A1L8STH8_9ENTE|nr:lysine--tRNA ligase [Enterococcus devriesei]MDT2822399.1 lysine--tRNA ligase [Enterococcus devriesei]OJG35419.1 lysine-tRNA ligase [Enterococcus devriesei]
MHWAFQIATNLIQQHEDQQTPITCASGVSPSGYVHVGNFREIATTYFVTRALKELGATPRYILSWDDYDRLRKIPKNVTGVAEENIGMPYTKVAPPTDSKTTAASYGAYFEAMFIDDLAKLNIKPEFIFETERYENGAYDDELALVLTNRKKIYDILSRFRTEAANDAERETYFPISLYCDQCGHDMTTISAYDEKSQTLSYECRNCGHHGTQTIGQHQHIKLHWKIDWPMRWRYEKVAFEPGGKDHSSKNGSFDVAKAIAKEIFDWQAPLYQPYDFVNIKGQTMKMSSSTGNILTLPDLLSIYTPELVLYLYAKYQPKAQFDLGLDDDVLRNYAEFERLVQKAKTSELDEMNQQLLTLTGVDLEQTYPSFNHVVSILSLTANNQAIAKDLLKNEAAYTEEAINYILERASYWIENDAKTRLVTINQQPDQKTYEQLSATVKEQLEKFAQLLETATTLDDDELMQKIYDLSDATDKKEKRTEQKELFSAIYQLTLNQDHGPRIPLLIKVVGPEKLKQLIHFD